MDSAMPKRFCIECGKLFDRDTTNTLRCPAHQPAATARRNTKTNTTARGYGSAYRANRAIVVAAALAAADAGTPVTCWLCPRPCLRGQALTAEHIVPRRRGGSSDVDNLAAAHSACNTAWNKRQTAAR